MSAALAATAGAAEAVRVRDLTVTFPGRHGPVPVVRGVSLRVARRETLGLVGESGSGKTMIGLSLLQLVPPPGRVSGSVVVDGHELVGARERQLRRLRGSSVAMVFQDPMTGLNPVRSIGSQLVESVRRHRGLPAGQARAEAVAMLRKVGIPAAEERLRAYPHMLSGGLRQRAMIALAMVNAPPVLVADEPTTALDATIQAQLLDLLQESAADRALIMITHDLGVAAEICDRVAVVYAGRVVETGPTTQLLRTPRHPYTRGLLEARPRFDARRVPLRPIAGQPPLPDAPPPGCRFAPRCPLAGPECDREPVLRQVGGIEVACWRAEEAGTGRVGVPGASAPRGAP
jgi:oligopeptide/dipeptide ABC transporter ATP-binding protein